MAAVKPLLPPGSPSSAAAPSQPDRALTLDLVLRELETDQLVDSALIEGLRTTARFRNYEHPLTLVAEQKWRSAKPPKRVLTLEALSEWLAGRIQVPYLHIDPLKVDFAAVGSVMSSSYANRYRILPVAVTPDVVTVATSEPFVRSWIPELSQLLRRRVELVFANPLDVKRYVAEFFALAQSVRRAQEKAADDKSAISSFEQLVQVGTQPGGATPDWVVTVGKTSILNPGLLSLALLAGLVAVLLHLTVFGRHLYAVGSNEATARLCGVDVNRTKLGVYTLAGLLTGWAGVLMFAHSNSGNPTLGEQLELDVITAVVIGGASLSGGRGTVVGALLGVAILGLIKNGVSLFNVPVEMQYILIGVLLLANVALGRRAK